MTEIPAETLVTVFGGSGFLGRHVVRALARAGYRIRPAVRRPDLAGHLQPLGRVGQIHAVQANLRYPASVEAAVHGADVVINLVGILFERGKQRFEAVQAEGAHAVAQAAAAAGRAADPCLGARRRPGLVRALRPQQGDRARPRCSRPCRPRPSCGPRSCSARRTTSSTASPSLARIAPALPLIGGGETRFQPVFVGDVAQAIARAVGGRGQGGTIYELGGPEVQSFRELMRIRARRDRARAACCVPLPFGLAKLQAQFLSSCRRRCSPPTRSSCCAPTTSCRRRRSGRPHACGARHRADRARGGGAELSVALPQGRAVPRTRGVVRSVSMSPPEITRARRRGGASRDRRAVRRPRRTASKAAPASASCCRSAAPTRRNSSRR